LCPTTIITRNEQVSGSSPLVGSLIFLWLRGCSGNLVEEELLGVGSYSP
jgi:hypothetical protein